MSTDDTRRTFLKWLGAGAGAAAVSGLASGCSDETSPTGDRSDDADASDRARDSARAGDTRPNDAAPGDDSTADTREETSDDADRDGSTSGGDGDDDTGDECEATGDDVEGPFHRDGAPQRRRLAPEDEPGERIVIEGTVYGPDCESPVEGALLDVWHANAEGDYYDASDDFRLRGQLQSGADGSYEIYTIKPGRYRAIGGLRPAHVHFTISSPEHAPLTTQMYFAGDPQLGNADPCGDCASDDGTLIVDFQTERRGGSDVLVGTFDIVLGA